MRYIDCILFHPLQYFEFILVYTYLEYYLYQGRGDAIITVMNLFCRSTRPGVLNVFIFWAKFHISIFLLGHHYEGY